MQVHVECDIANRGSFDTIEQPDGWGWPMYESFVAIELFRIYAAGGALGNRSLQDRI